MSILSQYHTGYPVFLQKDSEKSVGLYSFFISTAFLLVVWMVKLFEIEFNCSLVEFGIYPREWSGLWGLLFTPFLHADFSHLLANTPPLLILTFSLFYFYRKPAPLIFALIYLLSGLFVWMGGREAWHIGASGLIYGLAGFLFLGGILSSHVRLLTISLLVALLYGSLFWGIFPIQPEVSWESHLWGGLSGFGLAVVFRNALPRPLILPEYEDDAEDLVWQEDFQESDTEKEKNDPLP